MKSRLFLGSVLVFVALVLISASSVHSSSSGTNVGGPIISDTIWTVAGSPYIVIANVDVLTGVTLTIQPGVVVKFNTGMILQVDGTLLAQGTSVNQITFTSSQPNPQPGNWGNIKFTDSSMDATFSGGNYISGSILQYCIVEFAGSAGTIEGAIETNSASPFIDHCIVRNNGDTGIQGGGTVSVPIVISNNTVSGNSSTYYGGGIYAYHGMVTGNMVSGNSALSFNYGGGIYAESSTVMNNTVSRNSASSGSGGGIYAYSSMVTGNTVSANSTSSSGGGIYAYSSTVTGNTVSGNSASSGGGISADYGTVTGNMVSGNTASSSYYRDGGGGIYAGASTVTGNTVNGNNSVSSGGGIRAESSTVMSNTVINNKVPITSQGAGIYVETYDGTEDFLYNTVVGNSAISPTLATIGGVAIDDPYGTSQFHENNFYGNLPYDVVVLSSVDISGTNNYWGTVNSVDILAHVYDWYDDTSRGRLIYIPYLQNPDPNAPDPPPTNLRATFSGNSATLSWDSIPSFTTGYGYKIYYDTDSQRPPYNGTGLPQGNSPMDVGNTTTYTLSGLGNATYYFAVTGYDTLGHESWYSNEVNNRRIVFLPLNLRN